MEKIILEMTTEDLALTATAIKDCWTAERKKQGVDMTDSEVVEEYVVIRLKAMVVAFGKKQKQKETVDEVTINEQ